MLLTLYAFKHGQSDFVIKVFYTKNLDRGRNLPTILPTLERISGFYEQLVYMTKILNYGNVSHMAIVQCVDGHIHR